MALRCSPFSSSGLRSLHFATAVDISFAEDTNNTKKLQTHADWHFSCFFLSLVLFLLTVSRCFSFPSFRLVLSVSLLPSVLLVSFRVHVLAQHLLSILLCLSFQVLVCHSLSNCPTFPLASRSRASTQRHLRHGWVTSADAKRGHLVSVAWHAADVGCNGTGRSNCLRLSAVEASLGRQPWVCRRCYAGCQLLVAVSTCVGDGRSLADLWHGTIVKERQRRR